MLRSYQYEKFPYRKPKDLEIANPLHYPVVIVGAGPVGLTTAIDLANQGKEVLLLDDDNTVSNGSRAVCYAKRTLEILDRLGFDDCFVDKGTSWDIGRTFFDEVETFNFNLRPQVDHKRPGMVNLQQYYLEEFLIKKASTLNNLQMRFLNKVISVEPLADRVEVTVATEDGEYTLTTDWLIAADGARSPIRHMLDLDIKGKIFQDRFLIADIIMKADYPAERWFWFDPPFHRNQSALLHKQADDVWRVDFQLGWDADPEEERKPENVLPRLQAMLGERDFELEWVSIYTFQCRQMNTFNHGRVIFVGDSAHQVSPFGARGANGGIQDADNLAWKLGLVIDGKAPASLIDTYSEERGLAAKENIANSTRSTDFITPKSWVSKIFRNSVLELAQEIPFARNLVNSGRLSVPCYLVESSLNTPDTDKFQGDMVPGAPMDDAPVLYDGKEDWLLTHTGNRFQVMYYVENADEIPHDILTSLGSLHLNMIAVEPLIIAKRGSCEYTTLIDHNNTVALRYDLTPNCAYLLRPDQHVAARFRQFNDSKISHALARATHN